MAGKTLIIGCKLPQGIVLHHPMNPESKVTLKGLNAVTIIGADHASTEVDADWWGEWKAVHGDFAPLKSGAIFDARSAAEVAIVAREHSKVETGFEPLKKKGDKRAAGVKPADEKSDADE